MSKNERRFSIIMTVYDQAGELEENLPAFLQQEYEPGYEVIVVDESSTDRSGDPPSCPSPTGWYRAGSLPFISA